MKMINKGLHTDKKEDRQMIMKDSLKTNLRDFKKIFVHMKHLASDKHKPESSPFTQVRFQYAQDY